MIHWSIIVFAVFFALQVTPVASQLACGLHDKVIKKIREKYGEVLKGDGLAGPTAFFEIWASDKSPFTWTILKTTPNGLTCVMAVGDGWQDHLPLDGIKL